MAGRYYLSVSTDGSGAGTASTPYPVTGHVEAIRVEYAGSLAATTDVTVTTSGKPILTLASLTNNATNTTVRVSEARTSNAGVGIVGAYERPYLSEDRITVTVAQSSNSTPNAVQVWVVLS